MAVVLLAPLAFAQRHSVVVLPSLAAAEARLTPQQLELLTDEVRTIAAKLPPENFFLMKQDRVIEELGDEAFFAACKEGTCVGTLVKRLQANFGARCDVSVVAGQLYLKFELYGTLMGQSEAQTVDQFNDPVKNFAEMQAAIRKKAPGMFSKITKSPQEVCVAAGSVWQGGVCRTAAQIAQQACESTGNNWIGGACKSSAQIVCEATAGKRWAGDECKTLEQIACESEGKSWANNVCRAHAAPPAPAMGGSYVAQVVTSPAGASLRLNGMPYQGCPKTPCTISLYENRFTLSAVLSDHVAKDTAVAITMPNQLVSLKLSPVTYNVAFVTEPSGASLVLEGDKYSYKLQAPGSTSLKKGMVKVSASMDFHERKDTTVLIARNNQQVSIKLAPNFGTLQIKGAGAGWNLAVGNDYFPVGTIRLSPGAYEAKLFHEDYEDIDFRVELGKGEHKAFDISGRKVSRFGVLDIKPAYKDGIGSGTSWRLSAGDESMPLGEVKLLPGKHEFALTHRCYEDIAVDVSVERGRATGFDMQSRLALKKGTLALKAKRKARNLARPVHVNGAQVGETPFEGSVPLCAAINIGDAGNWEEIDVGYFGQNQTVEYTHHESTIGSHLLGAALDIAGAVLFVQGALAISDRNEYRDEYAAIAIGASSDYSKAWKKVEDANAKKNAFFIIGGAALALGIGVHIWF